jgi:dimeric dUTPase (all-alpha-NTP-PPase superfamily)
MNLEKLFKMQQVLRERINYNEPDRFNKLILALLVELGECANEWRGFKFWSKNQKPNTLEIRSKKVIKPGLESFDNYEGAYTTEVTKHNPLLEEYVDGLHFVLELGLERDFNGLDFPYLHESNFGIYTETDTVDQFIQTKLAIINFMQNDDLESYEEMFLYFIGLSKHFGFTWKEIEQAYMVKNEVNHARQNNGY